MPDHDLSRPAHAEHVRPVLLLVLVVLVLAVTASVIAVLVGVRTSSSGTNPSWPVRVGQAGSSTCTDPSTDRQWRVSWTVTSGLGVRATGFAARALPSGAWAPQAGDRWELRWNQAPAESAGTDLAVDHTVTAPPSGLTQLAVAAPLSPRFVTPDGGCTVYTAAFGPGAAGPGSVAVVGDSLVAQLVPSRDPAPVTSAPGSGTPVASTGSDGSDNSGGSRGSAGAGDPDGRMTTNPSGTSTTAPSPTSSIGSTGASTAPGMIGPLAADLRAKGYRVQIDGQGGRRWAVLQTRTDPLDLADGTMLDELRGLRGAGTVVAALGTNDAGWTALAPNDEQYGTRLEWTMTKLRQTLDELAAHGHCTVLVTMADTGKSYSGSAPGRFDLVAAKINDYLRRRATASPRLALSDWSVQADQHGYGSAEPWFGPDTIHLGPAGLVAYAQALTQAASTGCS